MSQLQLRLLCWQQSKALQGDFELTSEHSPVPTNRVRQGWQVSRDFAKSTAGVIADATNVFRRDDRTGDRETNPKQKPKSERKKLYALHTWLGFHLAAIMALVLATGTIATISHEIDWLIQHDMRVVPDGEKVSWGTMEESLRAHHPGDVLTGIQSMNGDHFAYRASVLDEYGRRMFVHVNQWTGEVTGETHPLTIQRVFRDLHRYLYMPNVIGLPLVTSLAFVLAVSLYTGLKTTRNWKTLLFRVRMDKGARIMVGDAHKAAGLWGIWFFVVIIVTGVWYLVEYGAAVGGTRLEPPRPGISQERIAELGDIIKYPSLDEVVAAAEAAHPDLNVTSIQYPATLRAGYTVLGKVGNPFIRSRANRVFLDPGSLEPIHVQRSQEIGVMAYLNEMADPLHFGFFGGLPTKLVYFVFGVAMTGLSLTGVWLTWRRLKTLSPSHTQLATMPVLFVSIYFCTVWYDRLQGPRVPDEEVKLATTSFDNGVTVTPALETDGNGVPTGLVRVLLESETGRPNVNAVHVTSCDETRQFKVRFGGSRIEARVEFEKEHLACGGRLDVSATFRHQFELSTTWSLEEPSVFSNKYGASRSNAS